MSCLHSKAHALIKDGNPLLPGRGGFAGGQSSFREAHADPSGSRGTPRDPALSASSGALDCAFPSSRPEAANISLDNVDLSTVTESQPRARIEQLLRDNSSKLQSRDRARIFMRISETGDDRHALVLPFSELL